MDNMLNSTLFAAFMFIGMLAFLDMGRRIGRWRLAQDGGPRGGTSKLVIPALNDMFGITTTRKAAVQTHPPIAIFVTLFGLGMAGSMLAGYGMALSGTRPLLHMLAFTLAITATVCVIMDLEYPRLALIRIDAADQLLRDVLQGMK